VQKENRIALEQLTLSVASLTEEMDSELHSQLSSDEQGELATLTSELTELREQVIVQSNTRADVRPQPPPLCITWCTWNRTSCD